MAKPPKQTKRTKTPQSNKNNRSLQDRWLESRRQKKQETYPNVPLNCVFALTQGLDNTNMLMKTSHALHTESKTK